MTKPYEPDDPSILLGSGLAGGDLDEMARAIVEEYVRLGMNDQKIWQLFRSPVYRLTHAILEARGEDYVREMIGLARARWGYPRFTKQRGPDA